MSTDWDTHWMGIARSIAERSKCWKRKVGAVIIQDGRIVSAGYNGAPRGFDDHDQEDCQLFCPAALEASAKTNDYARCRSVHAEINALLFANRADLAGATIYVPHSICMSCAKAIANSGVVRVVWMPEGGKKALDDRDVEQFFQLCGLEVSAWDPSTT